MPVCPSCGKDFGNAMPLVCTGCGARLAPVDSSPLAGPAESAPWAPTCPNCRTPMEASGELQFRVGGRAGGSGFLLGNWNQLSEQLQPFSIYHCPRCGRVDLYEPGR